MTTILLCSHTIRPESISIDDAKVVIVNELCRAPQRCAEFIDDDEDHLVLGIHRSQINLGVVQAAVRRAGFDPLSVGMLDLDSVHSPENVESALVGVIHRSRGFSGAAPEQVKLLPPDRSTRRSLLSIGKPRYVAAPRIDPASCRAGDGCRACVEPCPAGALSWRGGSITYDMNACVACGICSTACPAGAVANPSITPTSIEDEIRGVIERSTEPAGIRFRCRGATVPAEQNWYQVEVPCTGMLTVGWVFAPLFLGAAAVDVVSCSEGQCPLHNDDRVAATLLDAATIATKFDVSFGSPLSPSFISDPSGLFNVGSSSRLLDELAFIDGSVWFDLLNTDIGTVTINSETCTSCEMCARVCPTDALASSATGDTITITFDPRSCVGCGACVDFCPEASRGAISMMRRVDLVDRAVGRRTIREDQTSMCEICGSPVAPAAMLKRISEMLGDDNAATKTAISQRCINCRGR